MMKDLGAKAVAYGHPMPVMMVATYDENGTVNVMNSHWCTMSEGWHIALCIGESKKTHSNIEKMRAFTVALANLEFIKEADYFGIATGHSVPDKFAKTGMKAVKSAHVNAPIIEGFPLVMECELAEVIRTEHFNAVIGKIVNVAVDESVLSEKNKIDVTKTGMLLFDSFSSSYFTLGDKVGKAWSEGRNYAASYE